MADLLRDENYNSLSREFNGQCDYNERSNWEYRQRGFELWQKQLKVSKMYIEHRLT